MNRIILEKTVAKQLSKLDNDRRQQIINCIKGLQGIPMIGDIKRMKGEKNKYRLRVGDYRVIFNLEGDNIIIVDIGTRGDIYK